MKNRIKKQCILADIVKMFPKIQSNCIVKSKIPTDQIEDAKIQDGCVTKVDWTRIKIW
jgi:hypothetical protein